MSFSYSHTNTNTQVPINQEFYGDNFHLLYLLGLRGAKKRIMDVLLKYDTIYEDMELSREEIGRQARVSVRHVGRCLLELENARVLTRLHKGYRAPLIRYANNYILHPIFHELWSRKELSYKYPILKWVEPEKLEQKSVISMGHFSKNVPVLYKYKNNESTSKFKSENDLINFPFLFIKSSKPTAKGKVAAQFVMKQPVVQGPSQQKYEAKLRATQVRGEAMATLLETLRQVENFGNYEIQQLTDYPEPVLKAAYLQLQRAHNVSNRFALFNSICKRLASDPKYKAAALKQSAVDSAAAAKKRGEYKRPYNIYRPFEHPNYDGSFYEQLRKPVKQSSTTPDDERDPVKEYAKFMDAATNGTIETLADCVGKKVALDLYRRLLKHWKEKASTMEEPEILEQQQRESTEKQEPSSGKGNTPGSTQSFIEEEFDAFEYYVDG